jgi:hypothetical protein
MGKKTPPFPAYPAWTTAKFWAFVRSGLRAKWSRWPPRFAALKNVKRTVTGQRHRYEFQCAVCQQWFKQKDVEVDHIESAGSLNKLEDLAGFVERLFVSEDRLRVVCKPCHKRITHEHRTGNG